MRNKKLWNLCAVLVCIQCTISPSLEIFAEDEGIEMEEVVVTPETETIEETTEFEENQELSEEVIVSEPTMIMEETVAIEEIIESEPAEETEEKLEIEQEVPVEPNLTEPDPIEPDPIEPPQIEFHSVSSATASSDAVFAEIVVEGSAIKAENMQVTLKNSEGSIVENKIQMDDTEGMLRYQMEKIEEDGRYTLTVEGTDMYGNSTKKTCTFTVNRNGSVFEHEEVHSYVSSEKTYTPTIQVKNYDDVKIISCMVNGKEVDYEWDGTSLKINPDSIQPGKNAITLETKDGAGNVSTMEPWEIIIEDAKSEKEEVLKEWKPIKRRFAAEIIRKIFRI